MAEMSRAMRHVVEDNNNGRGSLKDLPQDILVDFATIVQAFGADLHDELTRRRSEAAA